MPRWKKPARITLPNLPNLLAVKQASGGGGGGGNVATFQSADNDGWRVTRSSPPTLDPIGAPEIADVTHVSASAAGATTLVEQIIQMKRVREPFPTQANLTADKVALSNFVYLNSTILGATNNSLLSPPLPGGMWLNKHDEIVTASTHTVRLAVDHAYARNGKPVREVKFIATDGTTTVEILATAMSSIQYTASGFYVPHFAATFDMTVFAQGAVVTFDAIIYPWVGVLFQLSVHADTYPSPNLCVLKVLNNWTGAFGTAYAYVDTVAGNDGTGAVNINPATAATTPYATLVAAATAIRAYNNANFGRNFGDGGVIRQVAGTTMTLAGAIRTVCPTNLWALTIEAADPAQKATTIFADRGTTLTNSVPNHLVIRNLTVRRGATGSIVFLDNAAGSLSYTNFMDFENCDFDNAGFGGYTGWIYKTGRGVYMNCTGNDAAMGGTLSTVNKTMHVIGCNGRFAGPAAWYVAGSRTTSFNGTQPATVGRVEKIGGFCGWSHLTSTSDANVTNFGDAIGARGAFLACVVVEKTVGDVTTGAYFLGDNDTNTCENLVVTCVTVAGSRTNWLYQDAGGLTVAKRGFMRFSIHDQLNTKSDIFGSDADYVGNWPAVFRVGHRANTVLRGESAGGGNSYTTGSWLGEVRPLGDLSGTSAVPLVVDYVNDASFRGSNLGSGDYTPGPAYAGSLIPAGLAPYPIDMLGRPIPNDGTGVVGAIQRAA